jgi:hypothetical protein
MAAAGQGNVRSREADECEWFHNAPYKFRRMNWTHEDTAPVAIVPPLQENQQQEQHATPAAEQQQQPDIVFEDMEVDMEMEIVN